ncbi:hypothetical protein ACFWP3_36070 [Streptomyces sp. NPDC058525]|uniref:hypothetical protein n=1 Tax=Streptomyces sp. NPDC058525 TaxID=3346538 RepID=UPI00366815E2
MTLPHLPLPGALATTRRVLAQLVRDPGSIALILLVPCLLLGSVAKVDLVRP